MDDNFEHLLSQIKSYQAEHHGALPPEFASLLSPRERKVIANQHFQTLSIEEQAEEIRQFKQNRWKMKRVPAWMKDQIDLTDKREVNMARAIGFKQLFPFLGKPEPTSETMKGTVLLTDRVIHGCDIFNIDATEEPTVGQIIDYEGARIVWVVLESITEHRWKEIT